jgi:hypothetical protein
MKYRVTINTIISADGLDEEKLENLLERTLNHLEAEPYQYICTGDLIIDVKAKEQYD